MTVTLDRRVEQFIGAPRQLFINGQWADAASGKTFETPNPATGETLARIAEGDAEDINRAVRAARKADGATALTGGGRHGDRGYFIEPTVLTNTRPDMKVVREEIFGPVVVAAPFSSLDEIAAEANDTEYGLGAGIWTRDISKAHALAKKLRAGTVWINCYNVFDASLPFGGYKQSGWGREMGQEVLHNYTEIKAVTAQL